MYDFFNDGLIKVDLMLSVTYVLCEISGHHQIPVNVVHSVPLNSVDAELSQEAALLSSTVMQTTTSGPAVHQASYNTAVYRITTSSPLVHQMYPLGSAAVANPAAAAAQMSSVEMEENDAEDLSAISALLSLKMFPAGIEQISPARLDMPPSVLCSPIA